LTSKRHGEGRACVCIRRIGGVVRRHEEAMCARRTTTDSDGRTAFTRRAEPFSHAVVGGRAGGGFCRVFAGSARRSVGKTRVGVVESSSSSSSTPQFVSAAVTARCWWEKRQNPPSHGSHRGSTDADELFRFITYLRYVGARRSFIHHAQNCVNNRRALCCVPLIEPSVTIPGIWTYRGHYRIRRRHRCRCYVYVPAETVRTHAVTYVQLEAVAFRPIVDNETLGTSVRSELPRRLFIRYILSS